MSTGSGWEQQADRYMSAVRGRLGVTKAAGLASELSMAELIVRDLFRVFSEDRDAIRGDARYAAEVLEAVARPLPEQQYLGPLRPDQWRVGLLPNLPGQEQPVRGNNDEFS